jgi:hypothetical protein
MSDRKFWGTVRELFLDMRAMLALIIGLVVAGAVGMASLGSTVSVQARTAVEPELGRVRVRLEAVEDKAKRAGERAEETARDVVELKSDVRGMREDLRLVQRGRPLPPLPALDGGAP